MLKSPIGSKRTLAYGAEEFSPGEPGNVDLAFKLMSRNSHEAICLGIIKLLILMDRQNLEMMVKMEMNVRKGLRVVVSLIREVMKDFSELNILTVLREANYFANYLAKRAAHRYAEKVKLEYTWLPHLRHLDY
ncbi:hypothetical protein RJ639_014801 [Escallonia herrerae]|uniref:RNase H type-1 domain-containing protein n=1 Tax=Escallonia herrerae TaxID=1293975 RepID=A0AA88VQA2_9ASTE|nr:hypothetical protein RJ639_014801 [Escallonia herrerae]